MALLGGKSAKSFRAVAYCRSATRSCLRDFCPAITGSWSGMKDSLKRRLHTFIAVWRLIPGRQWAMPLACLLVAVNRGSGLVLPASARYLIDDVIGKHN